MSEVTRTSEGHVLYIAGKDCEPFHVYDGDRQCPVCEGGLAVCRICGECETGLDNPCKSKPSTKEKRK